MRWIPVMPLAGVPRAATLSMNLCFSTGHLFEKLCSKYMENKVDSCHAPCRRATSSDAEHLLAGGGLPSPGRTVNAVGVAPAFIGIYYW
eukprot:717528-Pelagomonas_calceolata.AAC.1